MEFRDIKHRLKEAFDKLSEEKAVCERIKKGEELWTDVDCDILIAAVDNIEFCIEELNDFDL